MTGGGADKVVAGNGDDLVRLFGDSVADDWTDPNDPIYDADVIVHGNGGNDTLLTGDGADDVHGGPGHDTINAGHGANEVYGGMGQDKIDTGDGTDTVFGDNGDDACLPSPPQPVAENDTAGSVTS